jgi:protein-tyrosine-phosphatase
MSADKPFKVLLICTGNTCRTPIATGILKRLLEERKKSGIAVDSAGTSAYSGSPASELSEEVCRSFGIDISAHSSKQLTAELVHSSDLILVMTPQHFDYVTRLVPKSSDKTFLWKAFPNQPAGDKDYSIKDPIGGDREVYLKCYLDLDENLHRILPDILAKANL